MRSLRFSIFILLSCLACFRTHAQHTAYSYYDNPRAIYCKEEWNKANTAAHFYIYFPDGKLKAEGYMKWDYYHHYKIPYRAFAAWNAAGKEIQHVSITADSATVLTYDDSGTLRSNIIVRKHYTSETAFDRKGRLASFVELHLPDSLSYFKDYYHPDKWVKQNYHVKMLAKPLWPLGYGEAGNDGISPSGTYKIYFEPDVQEPHAVSTGTGTLYDSTGKVTNTDHFPRY